MTVRDPSPMRLGDSARSSLNSRPAQPSNCSRDVAIDCATILVGCFRRSEGDNPEIMARAFVLVLTDYPEEVVRKVTHPSRGLPSRQQWTPTVFELRQACENEMRASQPRKVPALLPPDAPSHDRKAALERIRAEWPELLTTGFRKPAHELTVPDYTGKLVFIDSKLMDTQHMRGAAPESCQ